MVSQPLMSGISAVGDTYAYILDMAAPIYRRKVIFTGIIVDLSVCDLPQFIMVRLISKFIIGYRSDVSV